MKKRIICLAIILLSIILYLYSGTSAAGFNGVLPREKPGGKAKEYTIDVYAGDEIFDDISVLVKAGEYSASECEKIFEQNKEGFVAAMLAENKAANNITGDLNFYEEYEKCPFAFSWQLDRPGLIDDGGKIITSEIFDAVITYRADYMSFSKDCSIPVHVEPAKEIVYRVKKQEITERINNAVNENAMIAEGENSVTLPVDVDGKKISYFFSGTKRNPAYLLSGIATCAVLSFAFRRDERKEEEETRHRMLTEYPNILQQMSLYLVTGMSVRRIWLQICESAKSKKGNPIYSLMKESGNELNNGISEEQVLTEFAEKTKAPEYVRFAALIIQNQKRGTTKLSDALQEETEKAFLNRKQRAIKEGEQAGTKLLLPMMILLVDVMVMIIVPAFWNV